MERRARARDKIKFSAYISKTLAKALVCSVSVFLSLVFSLRALGSVIDRANGRAASLGGVQTGNFARLTRSFWSFEKKENLVSPDSISDPSKFLRPNSRVRAFLALRN